ncbi:hypothetical protein Patl1_00199 [Pistacia atlantica]|uniref:Uncharacterized protein n=1 Tax=Pistacia atlantica TaxID=434234 RepID=A0ACC1C6L8_9ROSI|nr:hypothetical protein Patl1_00199 [Pistacia atlantica]
MVINTYSTLTTTPAAPYDERPPPASCAFQRATTTSQPLLQNDDHLHDAFQKDLLGDGIYTVDGEKWRHPRKIASYEFSTKILRDFSIGVFKATAVKLAGNNGTHKLITVDAMDMSDAVIVNSSRLKYVVWNDLIRRCEFEVIMICPMDWDINSKLFAVTFDGGPSSDVMVYRIKDSLSQNRFLYLNGQLFDVCCATNVVSLMVQDALEALCEVIYRIRQSI